MSERQISGAGRDSQEGSKTQMDSIEIRACEGLDELEACVRLQVETWGYDAADVIPRRVYRVAEKIGGQVLGAFDSQLEGKGRAKKGIEGGSVVGTPEELVGFAFSLPGVKSKQGIASPYLHSHMLAVKEAYRNRGIGVELKLSQRREALSRGILKMEWTFDPLEIKNAFINIHRLGAIVSRYHVNFYGLSSSRLQGGLPTDRLLAEWYLNSPRVRGRVGGHAAGTYPIERRIVVPAEISEWKAAQASRGRAEAVQLENRRAFQEAFNEGMTVLGFLRDADGNGLFELGRIPTDPSELE